MPVKLKLTDIRIDGGTQPRTEIDYELVHEYSESIESLPPVIVFTDGAINWLADGFHRYHAHRKLELPTIEAEVKQGSLRDAILYSVGANAQHGKRRTNADKRKAVMTILNDEEWSMWSDREIARRCAVGHVMVNSMRNSSVQKEQITERKVERNGTVYTQNTANIGKHYQAPDVNEKLVIEDEENNELLINDNKSDYNKLTKSSKAIRYAESAIWQLELIDKNDPDREKGLSLVIDWIIKNK